MTSPEAPGRGEELARLLHGARRGVGRRLDVGRRFHHPVELRSGFHRFAVGLFHLPRLMIVPRQTSLSAMVLLLGFPAARMVSRPSSTSSHSCGGGVIGPVPERAERGGDAPVLLDARIDAGELGPGRSE